MFACAHVQKKDWAEHHKAECKLYAHMPNRLNLQVRLTVRVMNRVLRQGMVPEALASLQPRPCNNIFFFSVGNPYYSLVRPGQGG